MARAKYCIKHEMRSTIVIQKRLWDHSLHSNSIYELYGNMKFQKFNGIFERDMWFVSDIRVRKVVIYQYVQHVKGTNKEITFFPLS